MLNALAGFGAGVAAGISPEQCAKALADFKATGMRQKIAACRGIKVVEDCYNANPDSMKAAMKTLKDQKLDSGAKKIAVLGDMLELGTVAESSHTEVGEIAANSADVLLCCGELAKLIVIGAKEAGLSESYHFETKDELAEYLIKIAKPGDMVWIKASRGMRFEDIAEKFYED